MYSDRLTEDPLSVIRGSPLPSHIKPFVHVMAAVDDHSQVSFGTPPLFSKTGADRTKNRRYSADLPFIRRHIPSMASTIEGAGIVPEGSGALPD